MAGGRQAGQRRRQQRLAEATALLAIDDEQRPDVGRLVVGAGEALHHAGLILRHEEDRLAHIPRHLFLGDQRRVRQPVLRRAVAHRVDARQVGGRGGAQVHSAACTRYAAGS
jgi:hypothetical protein